MKLFKNQAGFNDTVVVAIVGGIIGALFITGVFVWQEVNSQRELKGVLNSFRVNFTDEEIACQETCSKVRCILQEDKPWEMVDGECQCNCAHNEDVGVNQVMLNLGYDEETGWNIYQNNNFGFSMNYPREYIAEVKDNILLLTKTFEGSPPDDMGGMHTVRVVFTKDVDSRTYFDFYTWVKNGFVGDNPSYYDQEVVTINDLEFTVFNVASGMDTVKHYFFFKGNVLIDVYDSVGGHSNESLNEDIINTINIDNNEELVSEYSTVEQACTSNADCWCQAFDGAQFHNRKEPGVCSVEEGLCYCAYE
jgi:hypothetical protein